MSHLTDLIVAGMLLEGFGLLALRAVTGRGPKTIVANMHNAYQYPGFFQARYAVFMTGPSATADIEGVLIHGAQGIRTMTVIPVSA